MMNRIFGRRARRVSFRTNLDQLRVSFWFTPLVMSVAAILLVQILYAIDARIPNEILAKSRFFLAGDPVGIRTLLFGMATTTLATAGVVFSLLTLPLSTVAAQFGSRLLRIYLRDRTTQIVLGMFSATFCFCLSAAFLIPPVAEFGDLPQVTVSFALLLFLATFASLIALIQHISTALQAPNIVAGAATELRSVIKSHISEDGDADIPPAQRTIPAGLQEDQGYEIQASTTGYVQSIDPYSILHLAEAAGLVIQLFRKPGKFVRPGDRLALVWPAGQVEDEVASRIRHTFQIGNQRTPTQDVEYAVNQLVEVGVRAMSPAINDPFTAMTCLDQLGAGLALFVERGGPPSNYYDSNGDIRLIFEPASLSELLEASFAMFRHASRDNAAVLGRMLDAIVAINRKVQRDDQRADLLRHVDLILVESQSGNLIEADKAMLRSRCEDLAELLR